jgi:hypothetical protein
MGKLTAAKRKELPKKDFAEPGKRKYPIPDKSHAANAKARVAQHGTPTEKKKVDAAVARKFPEMGKKKDEKKRPAPALMKSDRERKTWKPKKRGELPPKPKGYHHSSENHNAIGSY